MEICVEYNQPSTYASSKVVVVGDGLRYSSSRAVPSGFCCGCRLLQRANGKAARHSNRDRVQRPEEPSSKGNFIPGMTARGHDDQRRCCGWKRCILCFHHLSRQPIGRKFSRRSCDGTCLLISAPVQLDGGQDFDSGPAWQRLFTMLHAPFPLGDSMIPPLSPAAAFDELGNEVLCPSASTGARDQQYSAGWVHSRRKPLASPAATWPLTCAMPSLSFSSETRPQQRLITTIRWDTLARTDFLQGPRST